MRRYEEDLIRQIDANNRTAAVVAVSAEPYAVGGVSFDLNVVLGGGDTGVYGCIPYVFTAQLLGYYKSLDRGAESRFALRVGQYPPCRGGESRSILTNDNTTDFPESL